MVELLYAIDALFKAFGLPGIYVSSMVFEWCMAHWYPLRMADDAGRDKTLNTVLKNSLPVPGAYIEDVITIHVAPCLHSPSVSKSSLPEPTVSTMPCTKTCESPVQEDDCTSFAKSSPEDPQNYDAAGYVSDQSSVRFPVASFRGLEILTV